MSKITFNKSPTSNKSRKSDQEYKPYDASVYLDLFRYRISVLLLQSQIFNSTRVSTLQKFLKNGGSSFNFFLDKHYSSTNIFLTKFDWPPFTWEDYQEIVNATMNGFFRIRTNLQESSLPNSDIESESVGEHFIIIQRNDIKQFHSRIKWIKPNAGELNYLSFLPKKDLEPLESQLIQERYTTEPDSD